MMKLLAAILLVIGGGQLHLTVKARPQILMDGGSVRLECRVPRIATYESVTFGIEGPEFEALSERSLPGPVVYEQLYEIPPGVCGSHYAYCRVKQGDNLGVVEAIPSQVLMTGTNCP